MATFSEFYATQMAQHRAIAERGEYPDDLARQVLTIAAHDPVSLPLLSMLTGVDMHQRAFRERIRVVEMPDAIESHRYTISSQDAICLLLQHGPAVFAKEFAKIVSGDARLKRGLADLIGCPELRPGPREVAP